MPRPPTCCNALAPSTELPLVTLLPRAWIGFAKAPWRCVGLASALLLSAIGPALLGEDLRQLGVGWLGDLMVAASLVLPLLPLLALLRLADQLLPAESTTKPAACRSSQVHGSVRRGLSAGGSRSSARRSNASRGSNGRHRLRMTARSPSQGTPSWRRSSPRTAGPAALISSRAAKPTQRQGATPKPIQARGSSVTRGSSVEGAKAFQQIRCGVVRNRKDRQAVAPFDHR